MIQFDRFFGSTVFPFDLKPSKELGLVVGSLVSTRYRRTNSHNMPGETFTGVEKKAAIEMRKKEDGMRKEEFMFTNFIELKLNKKC